MKISTLLLSFILSSFFNPSTPKLSIQKEAVIVPQIIPFFIDSKLILSSEARHPAKPPANESPAPVGSITFKTG